MTSPIYTGGMGQLQFDCVRGFTGIGTRTVKVFVNGLQIGSDINVSGTADTIHHYSEAINIAGPVTLELRTSGKQVIIDNIQWTTYSPGPTVSFTAATASAAESAGSATVNLAISPATTAAGTVTIAINGTSTATYGAAIDYTTAPAAAINVITLNVPVGATAASFTININNDAATEGNETASFTILGTSTGLNIGSPSTHVFTIVDDDMNYTVNFSSANVSVLESVTTQQTFTLGFLPTTHPAGTLTISVTNGPGAAFPGDYTTNPPQVSSIITVSFGANVTSVSFTASAVNDAVVETTEIITFSIATVPSGFVIGSNNSRTLTISDNDSPGAVLAPGDLAIVGVNAKTCMSTEAASYDEVSFFCFRDIPYNTELILTDNGYERCNPGQWGNTEGAVSLKRTGPTIPAGQVITLRIRNMEGANNVVGIAPDNGWSCSGLGINGTSLALNVGGEQLFFMQGSWNAGSAGNNNATFSGTILYAFTTNPLYPWSASCDDSAAPHEDNTQRSNLPPGIQCFSMAPTSASDFSKYTGLLTVATQRDWMIRIDDEANWTSYASCSQYNSSGQDWSTYGILPIVPGGTTPGLWRGVRNSDWFECKNWDDLTVPVSTTLVSITDIASNPCKVGMVGGLSPGGTGVCAQVDVKSSSSAIPSLSVEAGSTLNVGGPLNVLRNGGSGALVANVGPNALLTATDLMLQSSNASSDEAFFTCDQANSRAVFSGNITIDGGGVIDINGATTATLTVAGNWNNMRNETSFGDAGGNVVFSGNADQWVTTAGFTEYFDKLWVNKPNGKVVAEYPMRIRGTLDLTKGIVDASIPGSLVTIEANGSVLNTSDLSHVDGPVQKIGNTPFTFPVGEAGYYRPCALQDLTATATDAFTAEYFHVDPYLTMPLVQPTPFDHISHCEYWTIDRSAGTPNARVVLSWNTPASCNTAPFVPGDLRVAHWNGSIWEDRGMADLTGNATAGSVATTNVETVFSPWTLASMSSNNPLPIELLAFSATANGTQVDLRWATASEQDNAYFTVERSSDAVAFTPLSQVAGAGSSQSVLHYADVDPAPLPGLSYYRLRQTDFNGSTTFSQAVPVLFNGPAAGITVGYGPDGPWVTHDFTTGSTVEVLDLSGRTVARSTVTGDGPLPVPAAALAHGVYVLRLTDVSRSESTRFMW